MAKRYGRSRHPQRRAEQALGKPSAWGYTVSPLEREIQADIVRNLERLSFDVSEFSEGRRTNVEPGHPDLYARHSAWQLRFYIETKTPTGRLSKVQKEWHDRERSAGGVVLVCTSASDALQQINALRRERAS